VVACIGLAGCADVTSALDPLGIDGRDGGAKITYATLMRVGMAARAGGDYPNAVAVFRRAASIAPSEAIPLVAVGETLRDMGQVNEAIVAYNSALARSPKHPRALQGLAKAYLKTGRPELAAEPLAVAYADAPNDPKLLVLLGVSADFTGQHPEAQAYYRRGLELVPGDPVLTLDLALSLALTGQYDTAIAQLQPIAVAPTASARDRQTLALIYGLKGDRTAAERLARVDLDPGSVENNLAYYETLRRLSPHARSKAVLSAGAGSGKTPSS